MDMLQPSCRDLSTDQPQGPSQMSLEKLVLNQGNNATWMSFQKKQITLYHPISHS